MKSYIAIVLLSFLLSIILNIIGIKFLKRLNAGQPILKYVEEHKVKQGTPTMGGLIFTVSSLICFFIFNKFTYNEGLVGAVIVFAYMCVGFLDDFVKIRYKQNEGLKPYQKIIFQSFIAFFASLFVYFRINTNLNIPFTKISVDFGAWIIPITILVFISVTNCVNLTDGLDSLAGGVSSVYLFFISLLILLQMENENHLIYLSLSFFGGLLGFLCFNVNKASIFMGDTGSLALGGLIASVSIFSENTLFIPFLGIMFVCSGISVVLQVIYFKKTKKRIFLMAPLHHHFQHKGYTESKISFVYSLITFLMGLSLIFVYL